MAVEQDIALCRLLTELGRRQQDEQAWQVLFQREGGMVRAVVLEVLGARGMREQSVDDAIQEGWLRIHRHIVGCVFEEDGQARAWLRRTVHHAALHHRRNQQRDHRRPDPQRLPQPEAEPDPDEHTTRRESRRLVREAFEELPATHQQVVNLRHQAGWSRERVATQLSCTIRAVRRIESEAVCWLRKALRPGILALCGAWFARRLEAAQQQPLRHAAGAGGAALLLLLIWGTDSTPDQAARVSIAAADPATPAGEAATGPDLMAPADSAASQGRESVPVPGAMRWRAALPPQALLLDNRLTRWWDDSHIKITPAVGKQDIRGNLRTRELYDFARNPLRVVLDLRAIKRSGDLSVALFADEDPRVGVHFQGRAPGVALCTRADRGEPDRFWQRLATKRTLPLDAQEVIFEVGATTVGVTIAGQREVLPFAARGHLNLIIYQRQPETDHLIMGVEVRLGDPRSNEHQLSVVPSPQARLGGTPKWRLN